MKSIFKPNLNQPLFQVRLVAINEVPWKITLRYWNNRTCVREPGCEAGQP